MHVGKEGCFEEEGWKRDLRARRPGIVAGEDGRTSTYSRKGLCGVLGARGEGENAVPRERCAARGGLCLV